MSLSLPLLSLSSLVELFVAAPATSSFRAAFIGGIARTSAFPAAFSGVSAVSETVGLPMPRRTSTEFGDVAGASPPLSKPTDIVFHERTQQTLT